MRTFAQPCLPKFDEHLKSLSPHGERGGAGGHFKASKTLNLNIPPLTKGRIQVGWVLKMLDKSSDCKSRMKNPPGPLYKGEKFAPALRRSPHGERIKVRGGVIVTSPVSPPW